MSPSEIKNLTATGEEEGIQSQFKKYLSYIESLKSNKNLSITHRDIWKKKADPPVSPYDIPNFKSNESL